MSSMSLSCTAGCAFPAAFVELRCCGSCWASPPSDVRAPGDRPTPRARIAAVTANSISDTPASTMPAQTTGLNTSRAAQLAMSSPISQTSLRVPVRPAAAGSSDQATPRSPAVAPRRRHTSRLRTRPTTVSSRPSACQVEVSMAPTAPAYGGLTGCPACATSPTPASRATTATPTPR